MDEGVFVVCQSNLTTKGNQFKEEKMELVIGILVVVVLVFAIMYLAKRT
jgi:hypothetical protein